MLKTNWSELLASRVKGWFRRMKELAREKYESQVGFD